MNIFIAQPMRGKTKQEILAVRADIIDRYTSKFEGCCITCFLKEEIKEKVKKPLYSLGASIKTLSAADVVIFAKGWEKARGCRILHDCCEAYGVRYIEDNPKMNITFGEDLDHIVLYPDKNGGLVVGLNEAKIFRDKPTKKKKEA